MEKLKSVGPALWRVREVAEALGVSPRQIWKLLATNRLPRPIRLGRSVRWRRTDIEAYIEASCDMAAFQAARGAGRQS